MRDLPFSRIRRLSSGRRGLPELRDEAEGHKFLAASVYLFALLLMVPISGVCSQHQGPIRPESSASSTALVQLVSSIRGKAKTLEGSAGMRLGFRSFVSAHKLAPESINYSDYVVVRLLFEATRDAGFWNLHWSITDQPPNSDKIWLQWRSIKRTSPLTPTATAECDELSALYAFLVERSGVRSVGLFWPFPNHTVAVWVVQPVNGPIIRVVVPTSQIFLEETDFFDTKKFNPWRQRTIYEYTRRDVPDSTELPKPLFDFFLQQVDKYGGATDLTLQQLRYLREGVFLGNWTAEEASRKALRERSRLLSSDPPEDLAAFQNFAQDMRPEVVR
jgi:hypothetical protein